MKTLPASSVLLRLSMKGKPESPEQEKLAQKLEAEGRVIPDTPINVEMLKTVDVEMRYHADRLLVPHVPAGAMDARIIVNDGRAKIEPVRMNVAGGKAGGIIQVDAQEKPPAIEMDLEMRALDLARFFKGTRFAEDMGGTFGGKLQLKGNGDTVRSMLASSNGQLSVVMEGGKVSNLIVEVLGHRRGAGPGLRADGGRAGGRAVRRRRYGHQGRDHEVQRAGVRQHGQQRHG